MKLKNGELRPGKVLKVLDNFGTIRASVPGLFNKEDGDKLPPIYMWSTGGANSFTSPSEGDDVWVLFFTDNPEQLYWFRKDNFSKNNGMYNMSGASAKGADGGTIQGQPGVEVIASKQGPAGWATTYFSDNTGWVMQNNESKLQIDNDGSVILNTGDQKGGVLEVADDHISLGSPDKSSHPACFGDKAEALFDNIISSLSNLSLALQTNPYTIAAGKALELEIESFKNDSQYIKSDYVTLE